MNAECPKHKEILEQTVNDLWLSHKYNDVVKNTEYGPQDHLIGEIDVFAYNDQRIDIFEIKSNPTAFRKAYNQLHRASMTNLCLPTRYFFVSPEGTLDFTRHVLNHTMPSKRAVNALQREEYRRQYSRFS